MVGITRSNLVHRSLLDSCPRHDEHLLSLLPFGRLTWKILEAKTNQILYVKVAGEKAKHSNL